MINTIKSQNPNISKIDEKELSGVYDIQKLDQTASFHCFRKGKGSEMGIEHLMNQLYN